KQFMETMLLVRQHVHHGGVGFEHRSEPNRYSRALLHQSRDDGMVGGELSPPPRRTVERDRTDRCREATVDDVLHFGIVDAMKPRQAAGLGHYGIDVAAEVDLRHDVRHSRFPCGASSTVDS